MRGKRVLVVGGGNSGCDLACEAAVHAGAALHSTRRAYPVLPKYFRGKPIDQCGELMLWLRAPLWLRRALSKVICGIVLGPHWRTGLPRPDHKLLESHPIINSQLHHHVGHGRLKLRSDIQRLEGNRVLFVDGREDEVDLIIYATGFRVSFPFIDHELLNWRDDAPDLYLNVFHPERDDLFCIGLIQPDSGQFGLVEQQAKLVARYLRALERGAGDSLGRRQAIAPADRKRYINSPRHRLEVEHFSYRRTLKRLIASIE
jgi:cation diffusion facilitator CzcD-associated flavoprotein CzcO